MLLLIQTALQYGDFRPFTVCIREAQLYISANFFFPKGYSKLAKVAILYMENKFEEALAEAEKVLEIAKKLDDKLAECEVTIRMGTIYCILFDMQKALNFTRKGIAMAKALDRRKKVMQAQVNLTNMYGVMGKHQKAYDIGKSMVKTLKNCEDKLFEYTIYCNLSVLALIINQNEESLKLARDSLAVAEQLGAGKTIALAHGNIGLAQEKLKDYDGAITSFEKCLEIGENIKDTRIINNTYCSLGRAYEGKGEC